MRQGLSGFKVERFGNDVLKSTDGIESSIILKRDIKKQINSIGKLFPIASVPVMDIESGEAFFKCRMPYMGIDLKESFLNKRQLSILENSLSLSLKNRSNSVEHGLNDILISEVKRISYFVKEIYGPDEFLKINQKDFLCDKDYYIKGYCHGDLGFRNMFLVADKVYATDFTHSFVESPLVDIVMIERCLDGICQDKIDLIKNIKKDFSGFQKQMDAILKVKELQWRYRA